MKKNKSFFLKGKKIYLRMLQIEDVNEKYLSWLNDKNNSHIPAASKTNTMLNLKSYVSKNLKNPDVFFFAIINTRNNTHIGNIKLGPIKWKSKSAFFGRLIGSKDSKGKGYGTEAVKLVLKFSFEVLKLNKVLASCIKNNIAAIKSNEKNGMRIDTSIKKKKIINKKYQDIVYLRIFKKDWMKKKFL